MSMQTGTFPIAIACAVGLFIFLCIGGFVWNRIHPPTAEQVANMEALRQSQAIGGNARFAQSFYPSTYMLRGGGVMLAGYRRAEAAGPELGPKPVMWEVQQQQPKEELLRPGLEQWQPIALINLTENVQDDDLDPLPLPSAGQRVRIAVLVAPPTALQTKAPRPLTEEASVDGEEEDKGELDIELATTTVDVVRL